MGKINPPRTYLNVEFDCDPDEHILADRVNDRVQALTFDGPGWSKQCKDIRTAFLDHDGNSYRCIATIIWEITDKKPEY